MGERAKGAILALIETLKNRTRITRGVLEPFGIPWTTSPAETAAALGKIGEPAVELLITVLKDANRDVQQETAEVLGKITGQNFGKDQTKWQEWWEENKANYLK